MPIVANHLTHQGWSKWINIAVTIPGATERTGSQNLDLQALQHWEADAAQLGKRTLILVEELDALVKSLPSGGPSDDA